MAKTIKGITVKIGGDTTGLGKALESVNSKAKDLQTELNRVNKLLKGDPRNTELLAQKQDILREAVANTSTKLRQLHAVQKQVNEQHEKGEIAEEQYRDFQREIAATEQKLKKLTKELERFGSVGAQKVAAVGEKMKDVGGKIENVGQKLIPVSTAAAGALVGVSKTAIDFETAWTGVLKTMDMTGESEEKVNQEIEQIRQGILDMSQTTASSATDIAAVAEAAGQLGIKREDVLEFTKTMVMLGDSTNLSADEAATALAKFANITQMSADDYGKLGSAIVDLGNNYATTEADIVAMATRLASTGEVTGLTEAQILALATTMSSVGIEAEAGGSAVSKLLKKMYSANAGFETASKAIDSTGLSLRELQLLQANNSKDFKALADSLGMTSTELKGYMDNVSQLNQYASTAGVSVEEFRKAYGEDAVGALSLFVAGLNDTERNGKSAVEILNEMGLTEVRLSNAILAMASSGDLLNNTVSTANQAFGENTALTAEAEKRYQTTAAQIQQLKGALTELCVSLGETLLPIIKQVVEKLTEWINKFSEMSPGMQKVTLAVLALTSGLAPLIITIGKVTSAIGTMLTFAPKVVSGFNTMKVGALNAVTLLKTGCTTALAALKTGLTAFATFAKAAISALFKLILAHPVAAVVAAVVALLVVLYKKCEWFRDGVNNVVKKIGEFVKKIPGFFQELPGKIVSIGRNIMDGLLSGIRDGWNSLKNGISSICDNVVGWFQNKLKINSPSKVIADKIGKGISEGLGYGVEQNEDEAIKPMNKVMNRMISGVSPSMSGDLQNSLANGAMSITSTGDGTVLGKLDKILTAIERGQIITLDGKALVGGTVNAYDTALGQRRMLAARGAV